MRERTLKSLFDKIMWYGIYLFPLICYAFLCLSFQYDGNNEFVPFADFMESLTGFAGFGGSLYVTINQGLFENVLNLTDFGGLACYLTYLIVITIVHVIFDIIVFIPRLFHNFLESFEKGDIIK